MDFGQEVIFPRVLIVGAAPICSSSATGITLMNLFAGWPSERLAQIYDDVTPPDAAVCGDFRRFSSSDLPAVRIGKRLLKRVRPSGTRSVSVSANSEVTAPDGSLTHGFLAACGDIAPFSLPANLLRWVESFKPDVIYSVLGSVRMMNVVLELNARFEIPVVAHFMDDWPSTAYASSPLLALPRSILNAKLRAVLAKSPRRMTICRDMGDEYSARYGGVFDAFMNCVEIPDGALSRCQRIGGGIRFGFVGGLHLNRWRSLLQVARALQALKDRGGMIVFDIFAPKKDIERYGRVFSDLSVIGEMDSLRAEQVSQKLFDFDVLVHVESFLEEDSRYTRLSVSTKIPQYMASGRPILAYGPGSLSSIRYVARHNAGVAVVSDGDVDALQNAATQLMLPALRQELGANGYMTACEFHDADLERMRFRSVLAEAVANER